jgi:menaquinol-cytochrome c reductase iron-sulfur subunit
MSNQSRRQFLKKSARGTLGFFALSVVPTSLLTACSTSQVDMSSMANLGPLEELKKGPFPKKVNYNVSIKDAWVTQERSGFIYIGYDKEKQELLFMSPICTHLGCTAGEANEEQKNNNSETTFYCPCHGGQYDEVGNNIGGPPPRPLDIFEPVIKDGNVYISILSPVERK